MTDAELTELGLSRAQWEAHEARSRSVAEASAVPLPGPLLGAFVPDPIVVAGFTLRDPVASDLGILQKLDHPLYREIIEMQKPEAERQRCEVDPESVYEALFLWTRPVGEARAALTGSPGIPGARLYRERALAATSDRLPLTTNLAEVTQAIVANFLRAFGAAVAYQARPSGEGTVFTAPPDRATASAGGLTSSAASPASSAPIPAKSPTNGHSRKSSPSAPGRSKMTPGATPNERVMAT